jgi:hypothetical protein
MQVCSQVRRNRALLLGDDGGGYKELTEKVLILCQMLGYYSI